MMGKNPLRMDPARVAPLQSAFIKSILRRFQILETAIVSFVEADDAFGVGEAPPHPLARNQEFQAFRFMSTADKVKAFQKWFKKQVDSNLLAPVTREGQPWTSEYVESAYKKGIVRAYNDAHKLSNVGASDFFKGSQSQFLKGAFDSPEAVDKLKLLYTRTFDQLKGITAAMDQKISAVLTSGLANGKSPRVIARELNKEVEGVGLARSKTLARTEIMNAHSEGQLDSFEKLGIDELGVEAEFSTAHDDRVCPICAALQGNTYTVKQARGIIPVHPNCRCTWIPGFKSKSIKKRTTPQPRAKDDEEQTVPNAPSAELFGKQPTAVIRWMGKEGWSFADAKAVLTARGVDVSDATIRTQLGGWKTRGPVAELTGAQAHLLYLDKTPKPTPPPPKPPEPIKPPPVVPKPAPVIPPSPPPPKPPEPVKPPVEPVIPPPTPVAPTFDEHSATAIVRWMGQEGYSFKEAKAALEQAGLSVAEATIRAQLSGWQKRGAVAPLDETQAAFLRKAKSGGVGLSVVPKPAPKKEPKPAPAPAPTPAPTRGAPAHITFTGEADQFTKDVWAKIGTGLKDADHARQVGALVLEEMKRISPAYAQLHADFEVYKSKMEKWKMTPTLDRGVEYWTDSSAFHKIKNDLNLMGADVAQQALKRVRDFGGRLSLSGKADIREIVHTASGNLPKDWVRKVSEDVIKVKGTARGYFSSYRHELALSGNNEKGRLSVAMHELVHATEAKYPSLARLEQQFIQSRIAAKEEPDTIRKGEFGYKDEFGHMYTGRIYTDRGSWTPGKVPPASFYEVATTGAEGLFSKERGASYNVHPDKDYLQFMLGIFAGL